MDDEIELSRTGYTGALGTKLLGELPKQRIHLDTQIELQRLAAEAGIPLAEYVRLLLDTHVFGVDAVANMAAERIRRVVTKG